MSDQLFAVEPMRLEDINEVSRVERRCFTNPWPASAYRRELRNIEQNYYIVLRGSDVANVNQTRGRFVEEYTENWRGLKSLGLLSLNRRGQDANAHLRIVGFAGMWQLFDEAHITTIGVDDPYRGRGFGELLLLELLDESVRRGANVITLEVRVSNDSAIRLYKKYEFTVHGIRSRYYSDNGEDAYVMWSPSIRDRRYLERVESLRQGLAGKLDETVAVPSSPALQSGSGSNGMDRS